MIFVDEIKTYKSNQISAHIQHYGNQWCHLTTDADLEELHLFAQKLGIPRQGFQAHRLHPHYDLTPALREQALALGAQFVPALTQARARAALRRSRPN